jgi:hypothetical protein
MERYGLRDDQFSRIEALLPAVPVRLAAIANLATACLSRR